MTQGLAHTVDGVGVPRLRLLDLFCCAGGAGRGYADAGFDVVGVDLERHKNYPFPFIQADVLALSPCFLRTFDAIHASPPCQGYTPLRHAKGARGAPRLIGAVRDLLNASGRPWVIENVEEARGEMRDPVLLCGTMFDLGAYEGERWFSLERHRLFETNWGFDPSLSCNHVRPVVGVYGGHARNRSSVHGGRGTADRWTGGHVRMCSEAMGIDWMTLAEISEAIPPAYTRAIGNELRRVLLPDAPPVPHPSPDPSNGLPPNPEGEKS